ncbi:hypothetical protein EJ07DRAFT_159725 [Lizonia empirigonia]|nr:hypothetical protein EJ07DRAFT_159725 [Lizonia empirigonia]
MSSLKAGRIPEWDEWSFSPQEQTPRMATLPTREEFPQEEVLLCCQETAYAERIQEYLRKDGKCEDFSRRQKMRADEATLENIEELQTQEVSEKGEYDQHKSRGKAKSSTARMLLPERSPNKPSINIGDNWCGIAIHDFELDGPRTQATLILEQAVSKGFADPSPIYSQPQGLQDLDVASGQGRSATNSASSPSRSIAAQSQKCDAHSSPPVGLERLYDENGFSINSASLVSSLEHCREETPVVKRESGRYTPKHEAFYKISNPVLEPKDASVTEKDDRSSALEDSSRPETQSWKPQIWDAPLPRQSSTFSWDSDVLEQSPELARKIAEAYIEYHDSIDRKGSIRGIPGEFLEPQAAMMQRGTKVRIISHRPSEQLKLSSKQRRTAPRFGLEKAQPMAESKPVADGDLRTSGAYKQRHMVDIRGIPTDRVGTSNQKQQIVQAVSPASMRPGDVCSFAHVRRVAKGQSIIERSKVFPDRKADDGTGAIEPDNKDSQSCGRRKEKKWGFWSWKPKSARRKLSKYPLTKLPAEK